MDYKNADKEHEKEALFHLITTFQLAIFFLWPVYYQAAM
jgi:hypothetical protein